MKKTRYVMLGGFLGAGKTSALIALGTHLRKRGLRAGLITNDQSSGLVDTARVRAADLPVREVVGGCFCCRFDSLIDAARKFECAGTIDVLVAEPVGSCTDIRATVSHPLRDLFGDDYEVAPLSVLVDPLRCAGIFGMIPAPSGFSEKVAYIYRKQLEESDVIVINKIDLLESGFRNDLRDRLRREYPAAAIREVSCLTGEGIEPWFDFLLMAFPSRRPAMEIDYDLYAEGEALLGWLNARVSLSGKETFDGNRYLAAFAGRLQRSLSGRGMEIAHLKLGLEATDLSDFGSLSLTGMEREPQVTASLSRDLSAGELTINLRAEADPDLLRNEVMLALFNQGAPHAELREIAAFRPGRPEPVHRLD